MHSPNTTILLAGCNARCEFCSTKTFKHHKDYMERLEKSLDQDLPSYCKQVSISGGEPTTNEHFRDVVRLASERFDKIVVNTNGSGLSDKATLKEFQLVNHVNISRHHYSDEQNQRIFGFDNIHSRRDVIPNSGRLAVVIEQLEKYGVDVTLNCYYGPSFFNKGFDLMRFLHSYVGHAKIMGAHAICFRYEMREYSKKFNELEDYFAKKYEPVGSSSCPVCRASTYLFDGMRMTLKSSVKEPTTSYGREGRPYEYIVQPSGKITLDWAGEIAFYPRDEEESILPPASTRPRITNNPDNYQRYEGCGINYGESHTPHAGACGRSYSRCG